MHRSILTLITLVTLATATLATKSATVLQGATSPYVAFEAEGNPTIINGTPAIWISTNDVAASGGSVLYIAGTTDNSLAPHSFALYQIKFATAGTYHLYYRFKADAARTVADQFTANSCLIPNVLGTFTTPGNAVGLPNFHTAASNAGQAPANNVFDWQREADTAAYTVTAADVAAGVPLVLTIGTREAGFTVDRWILSPDPALTDPALDAVENSETSVVIQGASDAYVAFEAETKATLIAGTPAFWITTNDATASASGVLYIAGTTDNSLAPHSFALYQIKFATAGTYHLYYRFKADAARTVADQFTANSCLIPNVLGTFTTPGNAVGLPNFHTAASNAGQAPANNVFDWQREAETAAYTITAEEVAAGVPLVLTIGTREAGFTVDRWILSPDPALTDPTLDALPNSGARVAAPSIAKAVGSASLNTVTLDFTRPLTAASVIANRFTISGGLAVTAAVLDVDDPRRVTLTTGAQTQGTVYTVTVTSVTDTSGAAVGPNTTKAFTAWKLVEGWATQEIYLGVAGATVAELTGSAAYLAGTPSEVRWVKGFQLNNDPRGPNLGAEVSAFFTPSAAGIQNFYVFNDDEAELLLSSNQTEASLQSLNVFGTSLAPVFDDAILAASPALTANTRYLLVGRVKSGGGDFRLSVAARLASATTPAASLPVLGGSLISTFVNPDLGNVTFTQQPANATAAAGDRARFAVKVTATEGPVYYQWRLNGANIPGATRTTFYTPVLTAADSGKVYSVVVSVAGKDTPSANATLTVQGTSTSTLLPYVGINFVGGGDNLPGPLTAVDVAGVALQGNWNNLTGSTFDQATLSDAAGAITPVTFSAPTTDNWYCGTLGSGDANGVLLQGYISVGAALDPVLLTLNGVPAGTYTVIVYSVGFPFQANYEEAFSVTGAATSPILHVKAESGLEFNGNPTFRRMTSTDANNRGAVGNYVQFDNVSPAADGSIAISAAWEATTVGNGHQPAVNGIQLVKVGVVAPPLVGIPVAANLSAGTARTTPGDGLYGEYWQRGINTIKTDGNTVASNRVDTQIAGFGAASGSFTAKLLNYTGNDLSAVAPWLAGDGASFTGTPGNLDDGAFRFSGFLNVRQAGVLNIGTTSDDGSRVKIGGIDIVANDGGHGDATVDADVNFAAAGIYPIEVTYFNGDWTSDGAGANLNHSGSTNAAVHGGANFHLRINKADITPAQVGTYLFTAPTTNYVAARSSAGSARTTPGDGLYGEYWQRGINTIKTDGNTVASNRVDTQIAGFGAASGSFAAKLLNYTGNDLSAVAPWLAGDGASFAGTPGNLDDGAFRFSGFLNIRQAGVLNIGTTSDDGSRVKVGGVDIIANDGGHGDATVDANVNFAAAGIYPIEVTYFNGDWTSDGAGANLNHSGSTDPGVHGGANFHLRIGGADITPAQVGTYLFTAPTVNYVAARNSAGSPLALPGDGLNGEYWQRGINTIKTDGNTVASNRVDTQIASFGAPSGTFTATLHNYTGNDLSAVVPWLAGDGASFKGTPGNLDDGAFRFRGFINVAAPGKLNIGTTSDDGSRVKVGGVDIIANDGGHGDATVDADVNFAAAGVYPIEVTYFNGDWTSDGAGANLNHSGSTDPAVHGGANFHLRLNGADVTAAGAARFFRTADGQPAVPPKNIVWVSFHGAADDAPSANALAAGFTKAPDVGYTDLLKANGYNVTRFQSADNADLSSLNSADLVIISRSVASGHYQQTNETAAWNGLSKPLIVMGGYIMRNSRLGFTTGGTIPDTAGTVSLTVNNPAHPIFAGVALNASNTMVNPFANIVSFTNNPQRGISVNTDPLASGGTRLASIGTAGDPTLGGLIIGEWQAGATLANTPPSTLGGHRLVFLSGSREQIITSEGAGIYDLTADGAKLFLNAVAYMIGSGEPEFTAITLTAGSLKIEWTGGGTLESATSVTGPWTAVAGAASPYTTPATDAARFYRVRQP